MAPHPRNTLNELSGEEWLYFTKSVWTTAYPSELGHTLRKQHGANKPPRLMARLIEFFTKSGELVLDPFAGVGGTSRPGLVHRLDKDTSGLLVVAKTTAAHRTLTEALAAREIRRTYLALVWGAPRFEKERIEAPIGRDRKDRVRMTVVPAGRPGARAAATRVRVLARLPAEAQRPRFALVECTLETGRTHQIRVHLSHRGHAVVGDATYGGGAKKALSLPPADRRLASRMVADLGRQALHAARLSFRHPDTGESLSFESPLPADFARALEALGLSFRPACP